MKHAVYVRCVRSTKIVRLYSKDAEKEKYPLLCGSISLPKKRQVKGTVSSWPCRRTFFRVPHCVKQRSAFKEGNFVSTRNPRTTVRYNRQGAYLAVSLPTCKKKLAYQSSRREEKLHNKLRDIFQLSRIYLQVSQALHSVNNNEIFYFTSSSYRSLTQKNLSRYFFMSKNRCRNRSRRSHRHLPDPQNFYARQLLLGRAKMLPK